jgi:hypothetical protein
MDYKITNRQQLIIFQKIYNFIEDVIDLDEYTLLEGGVGGYEGIYELTNSEYESLFIIYMPEYWSIDTKEGLKMVEKSPSLKVEIDLENKLNSLFGKMWYEPMKKFIKDNFNIEIKTISEI